MTQENTEQTTGTEVPQSLGLGDLGVLLNVVDLATQRGAFRGNELSQVGAIYDKLNAFLTYVQEQQAQQAEAEETAESPEGE